MLPSFSSVAGEGFGIDFLRSIQIVQSLGVEVNRIVNQCSFSLQKLWKYETWWNEEGILNQVQICIRVQFKIWIRGQKFKHTAKFQFHHRKGVWYCFLEIYRDHAELGHRGETHHKSMQFQYAKIMKIWNVMKWGRNIKSSANLH